MPDLHPFVVVRAAGSLHGSEVGNHSERGDVARVARLNRIAWIILLLMGGSLVPIIVTVNDVGSPRYVAARGLAVVIFGLALAGVVLCTVRYRRVRALVRAENAAAATLDDVGRPSSTPSED